MRKLLSTCLVLAVSTAASASIVSLDPLPPDTLLLPSDEIVITVSTDTVLFGLDAILDVSGPATIVAAMSPADCAGYGWDPGFPVDPLGVPGKSVEIGGGSFPGNAGNPVGYWLLHCDDYGDVVVTLGAGSAHGGSLDWNYEVPDFVGQLTIHQIPEPMTVTILALGGLAFLRRRK
jgi:hypothetical protein